VDRFPTSHWRDSNSRQCRPIAISLPYKTAQMLLIVSWFAVLGSLFTAVAIAIDVLRHPQHTKTMNIVWPITGLYLPIVGWWLYDNMGRPKPMYGRVITGRQRFLTIVFVSTRLRCWRHNRRADRFCDGMDHMGRTSLCRIRGLIYPRLLPRNCVPIFPNSRYAEDRAAKRSC